METESGEEGTQRGPGRTAGGPQRGHTISSGSERVSCALRLLVKRPACSYLGQLPSPVCRWDALVTQGPRA